ncbi:MAG: HAD family phosphatase [Clostridia bacterium]|nr:HAD family phosphatase [Clostridia bacterium]MBQ2016319.1 HAD family phosphatase [Clostridia bacterium]MBQ3326347.1 HAD family phosphatase [Clostridia bacterium]MBQ3995356.1 HAD family phosphatase [Clostridia bacterium]MBQ6785115.1 HAD family phosphatase [Clostridia bacterium]
MAIRGAIFDMDGTLTESMHLWIEIGRRYLEGLGYKVSPEQNHEMTRMLLEPMALYMQDEFGLAKSQEQIIAEINKIVEPGYFEDVAVKPTVVESLEAMQERGIRMCVATATDRHLTEACLKRNGIDRFFSAIFTCGEEHCNKRTSQIYDKARAHLGTSPEETYIFEDTYVSILGAKQSGCRVVALEDRWSEKKRDLIKETADVYVARMGDLDLDLL